MKKRRMKLEHVKSTRLGRFVCRLFGDEAGITMMEYVVLGVLVVAAIVGFVVAFGDTLGGGFKTMITAIINPDNTSTEAGNMRTAGNSGMGKGASTQSGVTGGAAGGQGQ